MDGLGGYSGWRWLFIIEGLITVMATGTRLLCIPSYPKDSTFLEAEEKAYILKMLEVFPQTVPIMSYSSLL